MNEEGISWEDDYVCPFKEKYGIYRHEVKDLLGTDTEFAEAFTTQNLNNFISVKIGDKDIVYKLNEYGVFKKLEFTQLCKEYVDYMEEFMEEVKKGEETLITAWCSTFMSRQLRALEEYYQKEKITDKNE